MRGLNLNRVRALREEHGISLQEAKLIVERRLLERLLRENDLQTALEVIIERMYPKDPGELTSS
jgi:DNA-directed RNA polymerase subunit F